MLAGDMLLFWSFLVLKRLDFDKVRVRVKVRYDPKNALYQFLQSVSDKKEVKKTSIFLIHSESDHQLPNNIKTPQQSVFWRKRVFSTRKISAKSLCRAPSDYLFESVYLAIWIDVKVDLFTCLAMLEHKSSLCHLLIVTLVVFQLLAAATDCRPVPRRQGQRCCYGDGDWCQECDSVVVVVCLFVCLFVCTNEFSEVWVFMGEDENATCLDEA